MEVEMHSKLSFVGTAVLVIVGCGSPAGPEPRSPQPPPTRTYTTPPSPPAAPTTTPPTDDPPAPGATAPTSDGRQKDERIAGVKQAIDETQVDQARLAVQRTSNARVRDFATGLITEHECAKERQSAVLDRYDMTPAESEESATIRKEAQK